MDTADPTSLIDVPGQLLDKIVDMLGKVGIDLPAVVVQSFLLILVVVALILAVRALGPHWKTATPIALLSVVSIALIAIGIVFGIASQFLLPRSLGGRLTGTTAIGVRVELLDYRGESISSGGSVDTETGQFVAYYSPGWYGRARTLRISGPGCKQQDTQISRARLSPKAEAVWDFQCGKP